MPLSGVGSQSLIQGLSIGASGIQDGTVRLNVAANNIANADTPGFVPDRVVSSAVSTGGVESSIEAGPPVTGYPAGAEIPSQTDFATEIVNIISAKVEVQANAKVMKTLAETSSNLIDVAG